MAKPVKFSESLPKFSIDEELIKYTADVESAEMGTVSDAEKAHNKDNLFTFKMKTSNG
jgi:hypothetical protein